MHVESTTHAYTLTIAGCPGLHVSTVIQEPAKLAQQTLENIEKLSIATILPKATVVTTPLQYEHKAHACKRASLATAANMTRIGRR
jgi:hypothetical protein